MPELKFKIHDADSAPEGAGALLATVARNMGFVPNLHGVLAESPATLEGYTSLSGIFNRTTLSPAERQVVLLTSSQVNGCGYCLAAHGRGAARAGLAGAEITALQTARPLSDARLQALARFTRVMIEKRGWAENDDIEAFLAAGFAKEQILEVVLGLALKTISNYANHLADTPLDAAFREEATAKTD